MKKDLCVYLEKITRDNDEQAILEFINQFNPLIKKYALKLQKLQDYDDAKSDLTIALLKSLKKLPHMKENKIIVGYIEKVLKNEFTNLIKKSIKLKEAEIYMEPPEGVEKHMEPDIVLVNDFKNALNELTEYEKKIIKGKYINNKTDKELSSLLGVSRQAIYKTKKRAIKKLRKTLFNYSLINCKVG